MKARIAETAGQIEYTVVAREDATDENLQALLYTAHEGRYTRLYPKDRLMFPHDLAQMEQNYNAYLCDELHQENRTLAGLDTALEWLCREFGQREVHWWLTGSAALYVRGLALKPHDIDVMTYKTEIEAIRSLVTPYIVEPFHHVSGWVVKGFGVINYHYRIDVAFEPEEWVDAQGPVDFGLTAQARLETVTWHGYPILVPPIELQLAPNLARGRHERVALIRQYLAEQQA